MNQPKVSTARRRFPLWTALVLAAAVVGCSVYANLSFLVTTPRNYQYFPPFQPYVNANHNRHLGAEYFNIAQALVAGRGFADPFGEQTGPTAWMPPVLPVILAGLLWICEGNKDNVMWLFIVLQNLTLITTGVVVLALARQTMSWIGVGVAAAVFFLALLHRFHQCFQFTHDSWLVLLMVNGLVAGLCWWQPLQSSQRAALWGLFGGLCALVNPIVGFSWGILSVLIAVREKSWRRLGVTVLCAVLAITPWTIRNYLVFGRWMPVKSNAIYELYQSQCLQPDGLLQARTFGTHPYSQPNQARREYRQLGEIDFLDEKGKLFWQAIRTDPVDFLDRVASRFLGATLWYVPFDRVHESRRSWVFWINRLAQPLPFLALLVLVYSSFWRPLHHAQWVVIGVYLLYLSPYIAVSYYERYAMPLLGVKVLLVLWGADRLLSLCFRKREEQGISLDKTQAVAKKERRSPTPLMSEG